MASYTDPSVKHDALLLFDAVDSNPNGDPDNGGRPRVDLATNHGLVSDASIKRKVRDTIAFQVENGMIDEERNRVFIRHGISLNEQLEAAYNDLGLEIGKKSSDAEGKAKARMIDQYIDVRLFGAVMSTGKASAGKHTGPITVGIGRSLDEVLPVELGITRVASTQEEKKDNASQMGSKTVIPYGLYAVRIHYQPTKSNAVTEADLDLFWKTLISMFEVTRSAARSDVGVRGLHVFTHDSALGNAPARVLLDQVTPHKREGIQTPGAFADYNEVLEPQLPNGVSYNRLV